MGKKAEITRPGSGRSQAASVLFLNTHPSPSSCEGPTLCPALCWVLGVPEEKYEGQPGPRYFQSDSRGQTNTQDT